VGAVLAPQEQVREEGRNHEAIIHIHTRGVLIARNRCVRFEHAGRHGGLSGKRAPHPEHGGAGGTAHQPGSQLLFLLDTNLDLAGNKIPRQLRRWLVRLATPNPIVVVNTHPTDAVTVLLRYYYYNNNHLEEVLSFLVVLSCNETLAGNAFDLPIPGTGLTVRDRPFDTSPNALSGISAERFGDGRFLLTVTAVGAANNDSGEGNDTSPLGDRGDFDDPEDLDTFADWLFPEELAPADLAARCSAVDPDTIGLAASANDSNLNVLNASAISLSGQAVAAAVPIPPGRQGRLQRLERARHRRGRVAAVPGVASGCQRQRPSSRPSVDVLCRDAL